MKTIIFAFAALSMTSFAAAPAFAECVDTNTTASTSGEARTGIAKDGTHAPLEPNEGMDAANRPPRRKPTRTAAPSRFPEPFRIG